MSRRQSSIDVNYDRWSAMRLALEPESTTGASRFGLIAGIKADRTGHRNAGDLACIIIARLKTQGYTLTKKASRT